MKNQNIQAHRQGGKPTVKSQVPAKPEASVRKVATTAASAARKKPALPPIERGGISAVWRMRCGGEFTRPELQAQLDAIETALSLSPEERRAFDLIAQWEWATPKDICSSALVAFVECSFSEMRSATLNHPRLAERRWAQSFYPLVATYFDERGWIKDYPEPHPPVVTGRRDGVAAEKPGAVDGFEAESLRHIAELYGRRSVDDLGDIAEDLEMEVCRARVAARAVARDPEAWNRAGASNPISDFPARNGEKEKGYLDGRSAELNGAKGGAR